MARKFSMTLEHTKRSSASGTETHRWVKTYSMSVRDIVLALLAEPDDMFTLEPLQYPKYSMVAFIEGKEKYFDEQARIRVRMTEEQGP